MAMGRSFCRRRKEGRAGKLNPSLLLSCLSSLTVRNEYCQEVADHGGLDCLFSMLSSEDPKPSTTLVKESLMLLKTLAGNDNLKRDIRQTGKIGVIVSILSVHLVRVVCCRRVMPKSTLAAIYQSYR